jgi:formate hydrogenlyase transcriptional activator
VGDIPLELQPKLLRVLQEQEFERLGATKTHRVDVRLVAATNRNLSQMMEEREFREDLYFRLNVFPIRIPPLRERTEDIPLLVRYFVDTYAQRMNKRIDRVPDDAMETLQRYSWPGNVRELQNFIERTVILSTGTFQPPMAELERNAPRGVGTLDEAERQHIVKVLNETQWIIGGPHGAAVKLGLKRTTLLSKMERLGISRPA